MMNVLGGLVVATAVLGLANLVNNRLAPRWYLLTCPLAAAILITVYRSTGAPWSAAGLGSGAWIRGLRAGAVLAAVVAAGCAAVALLPATRPVLRDRRTRGASPAEVAYQVLVRIPLGTVLLEEIGFRAVLYGLTRELAGVGWATVLSATLFGLWHVPPASGLARLNPVVGRAFDGRWALLALVSVVVTGLAGVLLCEAQRRTGSVLAPVGVHWAVNGGAYLAAYLVNLRRPVTPAGRR